MSLPPAAASPPSEDIRPPIDSQLTGDSRPTGDSLPHVQPPTATFILQLFLIPLVIVSIVVLLWLLFSWMAHMGRDNPQDLVKALQKGDDSSWQRAYELADLLRSPDPKYDALRSDPLLAKKLADLLVQDLKAPFEESDKVRIMRRMYLCRAVGSFHVPDGLPALMLAAKQERSPLEVEVRYSALEALATLAHNCGPEFGDEHPEVIELLLTSSREPDDSGPPPMTKDGEPTTYRPHAELRAVAAYALGVVGGEKATSRLKLMLHDPYANARYNAGTGLARSGDAACVPVLREMLDPDNNQAARDERYANDQDHKRVTVLFNGIRATVTLAQANPSADISSLQSSLKRLADSPLTQIQSDRTKIQGAALEALRLLEANAARS